MERSSIPEHPRATLGLQSFRGRAIRLIAAMARVPLSVSAVAPHGAMSRFSAPVSAECDSISTLRYRFCPADRGAPVVAQPGMS